MEFQVIASSGEVRYRHGGILGDRKKKKFNTWYKQPKFCSVPISRNSSEERGSQIRCSLLFEEVQSRYETKQGYKTSNSYISRKCYGIKFTKSEKNSRIQRREITVLKLPALHGFIYVFFFRPPWSTTQVNILKGSVEDIHHWQEHQGTP